MVIHNMIEARKVYREVMPVRIDEIDTPANHGLALKKRVLIFRVSVTYAVGILMQYENPTDFFYTPRASYRSPCATYLSFFSGVGH